MNCAAFHPNRLCVCMSANVFASVSDCILKPPICYVNAHYNNYTEMYCYIKLKLKLANNGVKCCGVGCFTISWRAMSGINSHAVFYNMNP